MQTRLLFITSQFFYQPTQEALQRMALPYDTLVVSYSCFQEIADIYCRYADDFDACFVSGHSAKSAIERRISNIHKPLVHFQVGSDGLHRAILRLALEQQSLDFSRIAIDFMIPLGGGCMVPDYLAMDDNSVIKSKTAQWMNTAEEHSGESLDEYILEQLRQMWERNAFDIVFCQYSSIIPGLQKLGIPFRCPFISDRHLRRIIEETLLKLELMCLHDNHPAIIQIFPRQSIELQAEDSQNLYRAMEKFVRDNRIDCVLQASKTCCTLIASMQLLRFLTDGFQICRISSYLETAMSFPVSVAYGIGTSVSHAMNNVQIASKEAKILGKPFVVDSNGNLIGPLNSEHRMVISPNSLPDVSDTAKRCSLSAMTIQKLQNIVQSNGSDKITIPEMAQKLNTTIRNANRIMLNLCKGNVAKPVYTQTTHSRGRPIQVYSLNFHSTMN